MKNVIDCGDLRHRTHLSLIVALLVALLATGCRHAKAESEQVQKLLVTSPLRRDTELTEDYVAQVRAKQHIELRALEKGYVTGIYVDEGQRIAKGTKMFQIMPLIYQAEVQKAEAEAAQSEIEYKNTKLLADKNVVSPNELALSKAKFDKAKAEVSLATTHKSLTEIRAPFEGIMGRFHVRLGSLVSEGDLLTTLSDNSTVWVYFNVSESQYLAYKAHNPGATEATPVKLVMANGQVFPEPGKVETIEADFNNGTGNVAFRAAFPNEHALLRHGETGKIRMSVTLKNALLIPQKATFDVLEKKYVYVVDEKNVVHARPITVGAQLPQLFAVEEGLGDKDRILVAGLRKVKEGDSIDPDYQAPAELFQHLDVPAE